MSTCPLYTGRLVMYRTAGIGLFSIATALCAAATRHQEYHGPTGATIRRSSAAELRWKR
jgi:hypothetical protein